MLDHLEKIKIWTPFCMHPVRWHDGQYVKNVDKHLHKDVLAHQTDWDERPPIFMLAYRASTHNITGTMPVSMVFCTHLSQSCNLLFRPLP
jgi:hypothetical protein